MMMSQSDTLTINPLITDHIDIWTSAILAKSTSGRGSNKKYELYGITKLRELILELAVRGKLVAQDPNDESASVLLEKIAAEKAELVKEGKIKKSKPLAQINEDEKYLDLPLGWEWCKLGDIASYGNPFKAEANTVQPTTWILELEDIEKGTSLLLNRVRFSERQFKSTKNVFNKNDVLYGKLRPYLNKVIVADESGVCTTEIIPITCHDKLLPHYLRYFMKSPNFIKYANGSTHGMSLPRLGTDKAINSIVCLPPPKEQHRIVSKVDELMLLCDDLEQQTEASIDAHAIVVEVLLTTLTDSADANELAQNWARLSENFDSLFSTEQSIEALKQTVLQLAVMGKLVPQNPKDEPASVLLEKIATVKSNLIREERLRTSAAQEISNVSKYLTQPNGWEWIRLGNLAKFIDYRGKTPNKIESGVRLITAKNIRYGYIDLQPNEFISEAEYDSWMTRGFPNQGDTLFTPEAPLGNAANVDVKEKFALAQRAICFQWHSSEISDFMLLQILAKPFQLQLIDNATGMTATGIKASKLKEIPMLIPPTAEQRRIVAKVDELMEICDQLKAKLKQSQTAQVQLTNALIEQALA